MMAGNREIPFLWAGFGRRVRVEQVATAVAEPALADAELTNAEDLRGKVAVVTREACIYVYTYVCVCVCIYMEFFYPD